MRTYIYTFDAHVTTRVLLDVVVDLFVVRFFDGGFSSFLYHGSILKIDETIIIMKNVCNS